MGFRIQVRVQLTQIFSFQCDLCAPVSRDYIIKRLTHNSNINNGNIRRGEKSWTTYFASPSSSPDIKATMTEQTWNTQKSKAVISQILWAPNRCDTRDYEPVFSWNPEHSGTLSASFAQGCHFASLVCQVGPSFPAARHSDLEMTTRAAAAAAGGGGGGGEAKWVERQRHVRNSQRRPLTPGPHPCSWEQPAADVR